MREPDPTSPVAFEAAADGPSPESKGPNPPAREDLFSPSLQNIQPPVPNPTSRPWRLGSQLWVAFFGGALAATGIAYRNAERLGMPARKRKQILVIGILFTCAVLAATYFFSPSGSLANPEVREAGRNFRIGARLSAVALYLIFHRIQKTADLTFQQFNPDEYASLWKPGLYAVFVLGAIQSLLAMGIIALRPEP